MGKMSVIFMFLLCVNIIGSILLGAMVEEQLAAGNPYIESNSLLVALYAPVPDAAGNEIYLVSEDSVLASGVPQEPPDSFSTGLATFIDRVLLVFSFIGSLFYVLTFPVALVSFMGLPPELSLLLFGPLGALYIFGFIDLISGGNN